MEKEQIQKFIENLFSLYENNKINKKQLKDELVSYCARISVAPAAPKNLPNAKVVNQPQQSVQTQQQAAQTARVMQRPITQQQNQPVEQVVQKQVLQRPEAQENVPVQQQVTQTQKRTTKKQQATTESNPQVVYQEHVQNQQVYAEPQVVNQQQMVNNITIDRELSNEYCGSTPLVAIEKLTKLYKGRGAPAVNDISFNIYPGQFHAFIGANGAGKTTTIKSIIGAYSSKKYQGKITIGGKPNETVAAKAMIGYIPEEAKFPRKMTTKVYLTKMAMLSGFNTTQAKNIATSIINKLGLSGLAGKCPDSFSSGQKKKILLAQALLHNPQVLIMDEPAANLDPIARKELFDTLVSLQNEGKAIFLSSHILDEVGKYATYVTILDGGKIVYDNTISPGEDLSSLYYEYVKLGSVDNSN